MSRRSGTRLNPLVFVVGGILVMAAGGFGVDLLIASGGSVPDISGPLSSVTTYNFTLLGALSGGVLGAFVGFGLI